MILKALRTRTKGIMIAVAVAFVISIFAGYGIYTRRGTPSAGKDHVVAKANGTKITLSQIDAGVKQLMDQMGISNLPQEQYYVLRKHVLDQMVLDMELDKEVKKNKIEVTDDEIKTAMDRIIAQFPTKEAYQDYLKSYNIKEEDLKKELKRQLAQQKLLQVAVKVDETVTDEDVKKFYADNGDTYFVRPEGLWVNYVVFSEGSVAQEARDALAAKQPWDDVMKRYADKIVHSTPYDNPLLVPMTTIEAQKELAPLKDLKVGQISQPIQLDSDHVAIYLVKKYQNQEKIPFEEVKDNIKLALSQQKVQAQRQAYLQGLIDSANIEIVDPSVFEAPQQSGQPADQEESGKQEATTQNGSQAPTSQPDNQQSQQ
ncbi:MAG TPA: SurA N-terminal domain-containing protein [Acetomicrobium flavidum]|nr:SurA N-terminal domain-containing protein [Acetomicrobium mobile]HOM31642.1 SurA N-terminal domain-containing protein [Acetomicrobium flavidum]HOP87853.1 SurA N-terminal domain-containing protein [Acetomicrobium flavidum]HPU69313.1 SurA N-terminal domain-containing protein [Acetomicrobium flavidum]